MSEESALLKKQRRLKELRKEKVKFAQHIESLYKELSGMQKKIADLESEIKTDQKRKIVISEHAVLQYLARRCGVDIKAAREAVLPKEHEVRAKIRAAGCEGKFYVDDSHIITLVKGKVVTVT